MDLGINAVLKFTKGKSCLTNLLEFFEDVTSRVDQGEPVGVFILTFRRLSTRSCIADYYVKLKLMGLWVMF